MNETGTGTYRAHLLRWNHKDETDAVKDQRCFGELKCGPADYEPAYSLEASGLENVFYRLNMDHPADYRRRSLSVGDLVETPDGRMMMCAGCGWTDVTDAFAAMKKES